MSWIEVTTPGSSIAGNALPLVLRLAVLLGPTASRRNTERMGKTYELSGSGGGEETGTARLSDVGGSRADAVGLDGEGEWGA